LACNIKKKLDAKVCSFGHLTLTLLLNVVATLPCEMQKSQFGHWQR